MCVFIDFYLCVVCVFGSGCGMVCGCVVCVCFCVCLHVCGVCVYTGVLCVCAVCVSVYTFSHV